MTMDASLWSLCMSRNFIMKYIKEIITILVIIIGGAALVQNCKKNHRHDQVVIQHAAGASNGPGPFGGR